MTDGRTRRDETSARLPHRLDRLRCVQPAGVATSAASAEMNSMPAHHTTSDRRQTPDTTQHAACCTAPHRLLLPSRQDAATPRDHGSVSVQQQDCVGGGAGGSIAGMYVNVRCPVAVVADGVTVTALPGVSYRTDRARMLDVRIDRPAAARDAAAARTGFGSNHGAGPGQADISAHPMQPAPGARCHQHRCSESHQRVSKNQHLLLRLSLVSLAAAAAPASEPVPEGSLSSQVAAGRVAGYDAPSSDDFILAPAHGTSCTIHCTLPFSMRRARPLRCQSPETCPLRRTASRSITSPPPCRLCHVCVERCDEVQGGLEVKGHIPHPATAPHQTSSSHHHYYFACCCRFRRTTACASARGKLAGHGNGRLGPCWFEIWHQRAMTCTVPVPPQPCADLDVDIPVYLAAIWRRRDYSCSWLAGWGHLSGGGHSGQLAHGIKDAYPGPATTPSRGSSPELMDRRDVGANLWNAFWWRRRRVSLP
ncbi:hypothetical protein M409DRAFT_60991 [Zasmidium cellare ATCC 36951]|uniref:Uncharacterized protein n=1 Tax=Zasmidium cellare ATCC 36951 TaxID=1080233 RepID=A0A6A6BWT1_ZASCE|nr:uncharacterized protein M409DRAFT_60991 [Zasmidium cellare ATCC 36951]KAF2159294.1 hypothetical protein M409DRAFT_60991 [Zasmidium cellare ATCC 36951]